MFRAISLTAALFMGALFAGQSAALCSGPSLLDRLDPAARVELDAAVAGMPFSQGILWQAERDGRVMTIAGTMHIFDDRLNAIRDRLRPLLARSDLLLLEMTPVEQAEMQTALAADPSLMFLTDGPTLPELLDAATWDALALAARDRNIPPVMAAKLRPWFLMLSLSMPSCAAEHLASGQKGLDLMLMAIAERRGVPMQALEPWNTLFTVFEQGTMDEQLDFLRMGVVDPDIQQEMFVAMLDGYFAGDLGQVWELSRLSTRYIPGIDAARADALFGMTEAVLLTNRNAAWIPVIEAAAAQHDRVMVAIGAAHLPGDTGVLALLAQQGWTVTRLE